MKRLIIMVLTSCLPVLISCFSPTTNNIEDIADISVNTDISLSDTVIDRSAPEIIGIAPNYGYEDGGIEVTINGKNFENGLKVFFGDEESTIKLIGGSSTIVVINPQHSAGKVDVRVENPDGKSGILKDGFEYKKKEEPVKSCVYKKCDIKPTLFKYDSNKSGGSVSKVELAGQFTNWGDNRLVMNDDGVDGDEISQDGIFSRGVVLRSGEYEYKFILNSNEWINDPDNSDIEPVFKNSVITVRDGCTPEIISQSIKNGDIIKSSNIKIDIEFSMNGRAVDKTGTYFIVDGKRFDAQIQEEIGRMSIDTILEDGEHWYAVVLRDMDCNSVTEPSIMFIVKTGNKAPVANAGFTQITEIGKKVVLDGTLTEDPYSIGIDDYIWEVQSSPESVVLQDEYATDWAGYNNDPNAEPPKVRSLVSFTPTKDGYYRFSLKVSNQDGESEANETDVYVLKASTSNLKPEISLDIKVNSNHIVLDASSSRGANSDNLEFIWIEDIRNPVRFNLTSTSVQEIDVNKEGVYFIYLIVNDGFANSDTKKIFIYKQNDRLVAQDFSLAPDWFKKSNIYEIFVRKFYDSNQDGVGDLIGLKNKLGYLKTLGIDTIWLMPVFMSNDKDHGYHTIDYYTIDNDYGDNSALLELIREAHKSGIKVVLDMVINHTSRRHPFFLEAINQNPYFRNFYIWFENNSPNLYDKYGYGREMGGSRLTLENGWAEIPDLNYSNPVVRKYIYDMLKFWIDPNSDGNFSDGVDGFRIDHVTGPSHSVWMNLRRYVKSINPDLVLIAEVFRDFDNNNQGYGIKDYYNGEFDAAFTFPYYWAINSIINGSSKPSTIEGLKSDIRKRFTHSSTHSFFIENHDIPYKSTALNEYGGYNDKGIARQISAASVMLLYPNTPQILYGEELGITDYRGFMPWDNFNDSNVLYKFYSGMLAMRKDIQISSDSKFYYVPNSVEDYIYSFVVVSGENRILGVVNMKDTYVDTVSLDIGVLRENLCGKLEFQSVFGNEIEEVEENYNSLFVGPLLAYEARFYRIEATNGLSPVKVRFVLDTQERAQDIQYGKYAFINGNIVQLGNWVPKAIKMIKTDNNQSYFETAICNGTQIEYKYIIDFAAVERWDGVEFGGDNRKVTIYGDTNNEMQISDRFGIRSR